MQSAKFPQYTFQCFHVWLMFGNCSYFLSQKLMMVPISQAEFCQHNLSFKSNRYFFQINANFSKIIAPFVLLFPFCCAFHKISLYKPFDMSNDTKKQQQRKNVDFMDQLSLFCLSTTKHTHTHSCSQSQNLSHARMLTHSSSNISPVKHGLV